MFRHMDEQEIEINRIKDIQMIHFYNLVADGDELPAVIVYYADKKQMNLSELDKHYQLLLDKITGIYLADPDGIMVDRPTEKLLKEWGLAQRQEESAYRGGKDEPVFYPESYMDHFVVPIIKYYLTELYALFSKKLITRSYNGAWHGKGRIIGEVAESEEPFTYNIRKVGDSEYHIFVGNFISSHAELVMHIVYEREGLRITFKSGEAGLEGGSSYTIDLKQDKVLMQTSVSINDKVVYEENNELSELTKDEMQDLSATLEKDGIRSAIRSQIDELRLYQLPWGQYLGVDEYDALDEEIGTKKVDIYYIFCKQGHDQLRKLSYRVITGLDTRVSLNTYVHSIEVYVRKSTKNLIQVHYEPAKVNSSGEYKRYLSNRYYYYEGEMKTFL